MRPQDKPSIVILTGSGISKESGLETFRDAGGIWAQVRLEDVATPEGFDRDPAGVHAFYNARRRGLLAGRVAPNAAHAALAELERDYPGEVLVVTQNIDNLHERAGTHNLIHMHGEILKARCAACGNVSDCPGDLSVTDACAACGRTGSMRPDVVWFGEMPRHLDEIFAAIERCGLFVAIGTSGTVYPAAGFVSQARGHAHTVELNLEPSLTRGAFAEAHQGPASETVPAFVARILERA